METKILSWTDLLAYKPQCKAAELFENCGDIPDFAPFYIARGSLFRNIQSEYCHPCNDFNAAVKMDPGEWRTWHYLVNFLQSEAAFQSEVENSGKAYSLFPSNPVIGTDHAKALLNSGRYVECLRCSRKISILPQEGAHEGHDIFELANLSLAVEMAEKGKYRKALEYTGNSRKWPENLGAGKPYDPDTRFQDYISAFCHEKLGERKPAEIFKDQIAEYSVNMEGSDQEAVNMLIGTYVLKDQGKKTCRRRDCEKMENRTGLFVEMENIRGLLISKGSMAPRQVYE